VALRVTSPAILKRPGDECHAWSGDIHSIYHSLHKTVAWHGTSEQIGRRSHHTIRQSGGASPPRDPHASL